MPDNSSDESDSSSSSPYSFDHVIVFGEGPVKPIFLFSELDFQQQELWEAYQKDTLNNPEPDFWCMRQPKYLSKLAQIEELEVSAAEKEKLIWQERSSWQKIGWFAMRSWGRQSALAAGFALYKGLTKKIILSGGKTKNLNGTNLFPKSYLDSWPSEAQLMLDIIKNTYQNLFAKKWGEPIEESISIEDSSTNTLENFAYTINRYPYLTDNSCKVGFLTASHHLARVSLLANLFCVKEADNGRLSAQKLLSELSDTKYSDKIEVSLNRSDAENLLRHEEVCRQMLENPNYLTYWLGYLGEIEQPRILQNVFKRLEEPKWQEAAKRAFQDCNFDPDEFFSEDLVILAEEKPSKYNMFLQELKKFKDPMYRTAKIDNTSSSGVLR